MRTVLAPVFWLGRIFLWVFLFPIGVWRSLVHHRKKGQRKTAKQVEEMLRKEREKPKA